MISLQLLAKFTLKLPIYIYTPIYSQELPLTAGSYAGTSFGWSSSWAEPRSLKKPDTLNILPRKSNIFPENQWRKMKFPKWSLLLPRKLTNGTQEWRFDLDIVVLFKGVFSGSNFQPFLRGVYLGFPKASQGWNSTPPWSITLALLGKIGDISRPFCFKPCVFQLFLKLSMLDRPQAGRLLT